MASKKKPVMRTFSVQLGVEVAIDQRLLDSVLTDEWRGSFYQLNTPEDVAKWLAYNYARNSETPSIDGVADQPKERVRFRWTGDDDATEEQPKLSPKRSRKGK